MDSNGIFMNMLPLWNHKEDKIAIVQDLMFTVQLPKMQYDNIWAIQDKMCHSLFD